MVKLLVILVYENGNKSFAEINFNWIGNDIRLQYECVFCTKVSVLQLQSDFASVSEFILIIIILPISLHLILFVHQFLLRQPFVVKKLMCK